MPYYALISHDEDWYDLTLRGDVYTEEHFLTFMK
jgi:hypothetical protein